MPWKCGHTKSPENVQKNGRCLTCHRHAQARYERTEKGRAVQARYDRTLKGRIRKNRAAANKRLEESYA